MNALPIEFEWDESKAAANRLKHGVTFELARTIFSDPRLRTVAELEHGDGEERWFSAGLAINGAILSAVYVWRESASGTTQIRLISARHATRVEIGYYRDRNE